MSASFDVCDVEELLALMEQWDIAELHLTVEDATVDLVRSAPMVVSTETSALVPAAASAAPLAQVEEPELLTIFAPAVGVFHLAPRIGKQVQAGQIIGSIELMHVPNDLVSPVSGTIEAILADDGAGVEYGQPLMVIRPFEEVSEDEAGMLPPPR